MRYVENVIKKFRSSFSFEMSNNEQIEQKHENENGESKNS